MLEHYNLESILFLDIETVPQYSAHDQLPLNLAALWQKKAVQLSRFEKFSTEAFVQPCEVYDRAGIYAEFGKIVCVSTGVLRGNSIRIKSFFGDSEKDILAGFIDMLSKANKNSISYLCAHNGKEFDYPYLIRRMLINGLEVPAILDLSGKKPWEVNHLDTMELWKFGDYKHYTSLDLLCTIFGVPTPKDDIDGSQVAGVYYREGDIERIARYCEKDTLAVAQILLKFKGEPLIDPENFEIVQ